MSLTASGEVLNLTLGRFFTELATTVESLRAANAQQNSLVLSCEPSVAMRWLIPRLASFQAVHPDIALHLSVAGGPSSFAAIGSIWLYVGSTLRSQRRGTSGAFS